MEPLEKLPVAGDVIAGKYRIVESIGQGGTSVVYCVEHTVTHKRMALKWLRDKWAAPEQVTPFLREITIAARLEHPNVVDVYDVSVDRGSYFLLMELLEGRTLAQALKAGALTSLECVSVVRQCLSALSAAHRIGILHCDIKPSNVFVLRSDVDSRPRVKLVDFGLARLPGGNTETVTRTGVLLGTPHYLAPEQVKMQAVDRRTDVYACGVVLYECLSGKKPFDAPSFGELARAIVEGPEPAPLRDVDPALAETVFKAMAREPNARFQSAAELHAALQAWSATPDLDGSVELAPRAMRMTTSTLARANARAFAWVGGASLALSALVFGAFLMRPRDATPPATSHDIVSVAPAQPRPPSSIAQVSPPQNEAAPNVEPAQPSVPIQPRAASPNGARKARPAARFVEAHRAEASEAKKEMASELLAF